MDSLTINIQNGRLFKELSHITPVGFQHPDIRMIKELINNKKVDDDDLFVIEGLWAYEKLLKSSVQIKSFIFCSDYIINDAQLEIVCALTGMAEKSYAVSPKVCCRLSDRDGEEGFFLVCKRRKYRLEDIKLEENNLVAILDGLEKPGNIGSIIRSVDGAGGDAVIVCNRKVRMTHHRLVKASMGSCFILPVIEAEVPELVEWLKINNFNVVVTDLGATESYIDTNYCGRTAVVAGNEVHGISRLWESVDCHRVIIPMLGGADSLNVGFATTMVIYEASLRQKGLVKRGV